MSPALYHRPISYIFAAVHLRTTDKGEVAFEEEKENQIC